ncbi:hypothetical protein CRE_05263 [Caenorhabditis remanei]|uniref:Uncharacterized protein n=1 Tax=Caenorhabditis remanei TaxID=31234 RepID=E3NIF1_CAERE|nr:hypothetical protein CRE_05263 [Caenorhabditis remanei]
MSYVLMLLLRLRQACVHFHITRKGMDIDAFQLSGGDETTDLEELGEMMEKSMRMIDEERETQTSSDNNSKKIFEPEFLSCKMKKTLQILSNIVEKGEKV